MMFNILTPLIKLKHFIWGQPPANPKEARLLLKLDCFILSFVCLNYWINYVDRSNFANAYLSGMKEDLGLVLDQFNLVNTLFTVGYIIGMLPNNLALLKFKPRSWLSFCCLAWGLLLLGMYKAKNYKQLMVLRFFQAIFESSTFSGTHLILGSWYTENELNKRTAVFTCSGLIGSIFSGFMQLAIFKSMDGYRSLKGWQWAFIIDFIITMVICIYGFVFFPDIPEKANMLIFTKEEQELAIMRKRNCYSNEAFSNSGESWTQTVKTKVLMNWKWWCFCTFWAILGENESYTVNSLYGLWLAHFKYPVSARTNYPMGIYAIGIISTFVSCWYVDLTKKHHHVAIFIFISGIVSTILLLVNKNNHFSLVTAAYYLNGTSFAGQAVFFAWANTVTNNFKERAIILASMNMFSSAVNAWWSILFYKANYVPYFRKGSYAMIGTLFGSLVMAIMIRVLQKNEENRKSITDYESEKIIKKSTSSTV